MRLAGVKPGDVVLCDVRGREFYALVGDPPGVEMSSLLIAPITPGITYRQVTAREVVAHWRHSSRSTTAPEAQSTRPPAPVEEASRA